MFHIKICGIRSDADLESVRLSGADAVGFNFFRSSPRYVELPIAAQLAQLASPLARVGVFVSPTADEVQAVASHVACDYLQLHGDEPPELLADLPAIPTIKAFRWTGQMQPIRAFVDACERRGVRLAAVLVDAPHWSAYGGTGRTFDWKGLAEQLALPLEVPLILAGGLSAQNVAQAIRTVRPGAVDVASGVEQPAGVKDAGLVQAFVREAKIAYRDLPSR